MRLVRMLLLLGLAFGLVQIALNPPESLRIWSLAQNPWLVGFGMLALVSIPLVFGMKDGLNLLADGLERRLERRKREILASIPDE